MAKKEKKTYKRILLGLAALFVLCALVVALSGDAFVAYLKGLRKNPFVQSDFAQLGDYLTCTAAESVRGIDVSSHQGEIDWQAVKASGVEYAIIRVGFRGYGNGALMADQRAQENYQGAKQAGLQVGAYFFSQAISVEEAVEEAEFFLELTKDWELDLWSVYDWETMGAEARTANMDADTLTQCTLAFLERVAQEGHRPMVYFNRTQSEKLLHMSELAQYELWLAMYHDPIETFAYRPDLWQYTNTGKVDGIAGNVDINLWFPKN